MIRFRLKERIADREFTLGRRVTLNEVSEATGIHRTTLSKISAARGYTTTTDVLDRLCRYLDCRIDELIEYVPDDAVGEGTGGGTQ